MKKKAKTALAAVTASLLLATGLAGTANAKDVWNRGGSVLDIFHGYSTGGCIRSMC